MFTIQTFLNHKKISYVAAVHMRFLQQVGVVVIVLCTGFHIILN